MKLVGITGGIGSGKSLVSQIFSSLNIPVFNSDIKAKQLMQSNKEFKKEIVKILGAESYSKGILNRNYISEIIFNNPKKLKQLNEQVHPCVRSEFKKWASSYKNKPYVLQEAAILFESGAYHTLDYIILVDAPEQLRIERVQKRDSMSSEKIRKRMLNQSSAEINRQFADFIINNNNNELLLPQVLKIDSILRK